MPGIQRYKTLNNYNSVVSEKSSLYGGEPGIPLTKICAENEAVIQFGSNNKGGIDITCSPVDGTKSRTVKQELSMEDVPVSMTELCKKGGVVTGVKFTSPYSATIDCSWFKKVSPGNCSSEFPSCTQSNSSSVCTGPDNYCNIPTGSMSGCCQHPVTNSQKNLSGSNPGFCGYPYAVNGIQSIQGEWSSTGCSPIFSNMN